MHTHTHSPVSGHGILYAVRVVVVLRGSSHQQAVVNQGLQQRHVVSQSRGLHLNRTHEHGGRSGCDTGNASHFFRLALLQDGIDACEANHLLADSSHLAASYARHSIGKVLQMLEQLHPKGQRLASAGHETRLTGVPPHFR